MTLHPIGKEASIPQIGELGKCASCRYCDFEQFKATGTEFCGNEWACDSTNDFAEYQPIGKKSMQERGLA